MVEFAIEGDVNFAASRILVPMAIATVLPGVTVPTTATVSIGTVAIPGGGTTTVASVLSPVPVVDSLGGTVATIQAPVTVATVQALANMAVASLIGSVGSPIAIAGGTVSYMGTIATVLAPVPTAPVSTKAVFATVSATVSAAGDTLYGVAVTPYGGGGTVLLITGSFTFPIIVTGSVTVTVNFGDRGVATSGSIIASLMGTLAVIVNHF